MASSTRGFGRRVFPAARRVAVLLAGCLGLALVACDGVSDAEEDAIVAWLGCEECTEGERSFVVDSIGERAVPFLRDALLELPDEYRVNMERRFGARWSRLESPPVDSARYVERFMANFHAVVQRRAARALGDLGQEEILQEALDREAALGFRDDVVRVLEQSLSLAISANRRGAAASASVDSLKVWPESLVVEVGSTALVEAVATGPDGELVQVPVSWSSANPAVATVTPRSGRPSATVTGVDPAPTEITAAAGQQSARVGVTVVPVTAPGLVLTREHGNLQTGNPDVLLPDSLVVRVTDSGGTPQDAVLVTWDVRFGGAEFPGSGTGTDTTRTGPDGRSWIELRLGPDPGPAQVKASLSGGASVVFRLRAVSP